MKKVSIVYLALAIVFAGVVGPAAAQDKPAHVAQHESGKGVLRLLPADAVTEILKFDAAHPQLTGWAMIGGWPLFRSSQSMAMMNEIQKRNLKVVAVDALPEELVYLERGLVPVLWAQPVYDWGTVGVSTIVDKVLLKI